MNQDIVTELRLKQKKKHPWALSFTANWVACVGTRNASSWSNNTRQEAFVRMSCTSAMPSATNWWRHVPVHSPAQSEISLWSWNVRPFVPGQPDKYCQQITKKLHRVIRQTWCKRFVAIVVDWFVVFKIQYGLNINLIELDLVRKSSLLRFRWGVLWGYNYISQMLCTSHIYLYIYFAYKYMCTNHNFQMYMCVACYSSIWNPQFSSPQ